MSLEFSKTTLEINDNSAKYSKFWDEMNFNLYSVFYPNINQVWKRNKDIFTQERSKNLFLTHAYLEATEECVKHRVKQGRGRYKTWKAG